MSKTSRKSYSKEFKVNAVKMVLEEGRKASEVRINVESGDSIFNFHLHNF